MMSRNHDEGIIIMQKKQQKQNKTEPQKNVIFRCCDNSGQRHD